MFVAVSDEVKEELIKGGLAKDKVKVIYNGTPNYKILQNIFESIKNKKIENALETFNNLWILRFESSDLLDGFFKIAKSLDNYEVIKIIGKYQLRLNDGVNSKVLFYGMFNEISKLFI